MIAYRKVFEILKKHAKSDYWQVLYFQSKEIQGIRLFNNEIDLSALQIDFLNELSFIASIQMDVSLGDAPDYILKDDIYCQAYSFYKSKSRKKKKTQNIDVPTQAKLAKRNEEIVNKNQWVFTKVKGNKK